MTYETLFDAATVPFHYGRAVALLLAGAFSIWWGVRRLRNTDLGVLGLYRGIKSLALVVAGLGMFVLVGHDWWEYQTLQASVGGGQGIEQVEGIVQDHWIKERTRDTTDEVRVEIIEHFRISQTHFEFTRTTREGQYFTNAPDHRVKLRDGMRLRIAYVEADDSNKIVKLELAR